MAGKIQKQDVKTEAELIAGGGTAADLANDTQIYITALGINKTLDDAITDGDIGGGGIMADGSVPFTADQSMGGNNLTDIAAITRICQAGVAFNANTLYIVRWGVRNNGGAQNTAPFPRIFKADVQVPVDRSTIGWVYSPIAVSVDDMVEVYISGTITLASNVFTASDVGQLLFLHTSTPGDYQLTIPLIAPIGMAGVVVALDQIQVMFQNAIYPKSVSTIEIRLANGVYLKGYDTTASDFDILQINNANKIEFGSLPIFGGSDFITRNKIVYYEGTSAGGSATETLTFTGLGATDDILSVSQRVDGANVNGETPYGWSNQTTNALDISWTLDPGAGAIIRIAVLKV